MGLVHAIASMFITAYAYWAFTTWWHRRICDHTFSKGECLRCGKKQKQKPQRKGKDEQ